MPSAQPPLTNPGGLGHPSLQGEWYPAAVVKDVPAGRKFAFEDNTSMVMKLSDLDEFVRVRAAATLHHGHAEQVVESRMPKHSANEKSKEGNKRSAAELSLGEDPEEVGW